MQRRLSHGTGIAAKALFDLFGMWYAKEGSKAVDFGDQVKTLGLLVELGNVRNGFSLGHTAERREELKAALLDVLQEGKIEPKQAERLRGRMQWFEGYAFGRVAQFSLKVLGDLSPKKQKTVRVADHKLRATELLVKRVAEARAIEISSVFPSAFLIFTDGACEGESSRIGSVGGVLVSPNGKCCQLTS